ncbi:MAG: hypothetical protein LIO54_03745 [Oscillospiraceae bacterium]|nr:hypothetical protein [Oscillospiraceae bacterium]
MSVPRARRKVAWSEFERQAMLLLRHTHNVLEHTPKRYVKYVCPQIYEITTRICNDAVFANEQYAKDPEQAAERASLIDDALRALPELQRPLWVYWNLRGTKESSQKFWCDMANNEGRLLCRVLRDAEREETILKIRPLPVHQINEAQYLGKIAALHRYTYQKIVHEPERWRNYVLENIVRLADDALCSAIDGNRKIPETAAEAERRAKNLRHALHCLNAMQRPMFALWNLHMYSETAMQEWADLTDDSIRLLQSVISSDKDRFKDLT